MAASAPPSAEESVVRPFAPAFRLAVAALVAACFLSTTSAARGLGDAQRRTRLPAAPEASEPGTPPSTAAVALSERLVGLGGAEPTVADLVAQLSLFVGTMVDEPGGLAEQDVEAVVSGLGLGGDEAAKALRL